MKQITRSLALLVSLMLSTSLFAQEQDRVELVEDRQTLVTELRIGAVDGAIELSDVFRAVSRFNGYNDAELKDALPNGRVALDSKSVRWSVDAFNRVMRPCMEAGTADGALQISVDRQATQDWVNNRKQDVRWAFSKIYWPTESPDYGLEIIGDAEEPADFVVLVHGLNSHPEDLISFIPLIEEAELTTATFRYPNDQPVTDSATLLARELSALRTKYPNRKVRLLTHSMGGLVARAVIETELDPGNVSQLIMVAPPNHGSSLAKVATFMDCYEFFSSTDRRGGVLVECVADGLGEAAADIAPRSVFLDHLNTKKRNPKVRYSILLGTEGPMEENELDALRKTVRDYTDGNRYTRFLTSKLNNALDDLDEVVSGKGDGAVSCERGKLAGVDDVLELPFSHASILSANANGSKIAYSAILSRLK